LEVEWPGREEAMIEDALSQGPSEGIDYGHPLEFGYFLVADAGDPEAVLETARLVDDLGYDGLGVQDRPYQSRHPDTLSLLATILAETRSVRVFADVGNLPLRPPAMLAKAAPTLDLLSGGRFELGIGAGGFLDAAHAMGLWIGANRPRALPLTGYVADGWVSPLMYYKPPREAAQANLILDRAASEAGPDPRAIRRTYNQVRERVAERRAPLSTPEAKRR
jgi:alkanesulfonate monooxygenase SsuD/methylene tetrahydromethanopterin reductase-like flavin-dependent oxidoreductase (luciferase family)